MNDGKHDSPASAEIHHRVRLVSGLRNPCLSLGQARKVNAPPYGGSTKLPGDPPPAEPAAPGIMPPEPIR